MRGFSLVEVIIALVVVSILASISYPSYVAYVEKSRRAEAVGALLTLATKQEKYYQNAGTYTNDMTQLGYSSDPALTPKSVYQIDAVLAAGGQSYTLTATRHGAQTADTKCGDLVYTSTGVKTALNNSTSDPLKDCWGK